jgi:hypothetical protein
MPNYLVELEDGRKLQVEADSQPTEQEVLAALGDSAPAEKQRPFIDITDTASALGEFARGIPTTTKSSYYQIKEGLDNPWKRSESYLAAGKATQEYQKELDAAEAAAVESGDTSSVSSAFRAAAPSSGFSVGAMGSALAGGSLLGTIGGRVGAAMGGPAGLAAGEIGGRAVGAFAGSYGAAYRAAGAQFLDDARDEINHIAETKFGRPLTEAEQEEAYQELLPLAQAFGNAEAGPEAIGNLAMGAAGRFVLGLGRETVKRLATSALAKAGAVAGGATVELGGETATQVEQRRIEEQKQALLEGRDPAAVAAAQPDRTVAEYATALEEVGPATLATLFLMGGAGKVASKVLDMSRPAPVSLTEEELRASVDLGYAKAKLDEERANAAEDTGYQSSRAILKAQRAREGYEKVRQTLAEGDIEEAAKLMRVKIVEQSVLATAEEETAATATATANVEIDGAGTWNSDSGVPLEVAKGIIESKDTKGIQSLIDNGVLTPPQVIPVVEGNPALEEIDRNLGVAEATGVAPATVAALRNTSGVATPDPANDAIRASIDEALATGRPFTAEEAAFMRGAPAAPAAPAPAAPAAPAPAAPAAPAFESRNTEMLPDEDNFGGKFDKPLRIKPDSYVNKDGIETVEYTNPQTGLVDAYISAFGNNDFVAYMRVYDANGKPTNRFTSKLERRTQRAGATKAMLEELQSRLPEGHEYTEDVSVSTDGLKFIAGQLQQGYEVVRDATGNAVTSEVAISGESIVNDLPVAVDPNGKFENIRVSSPAEFAKVRPVIAKMLEKFGVGLTEQNVRWENGTVFIDLPVLRKAVPAEQPVAEEVADPFTPVVETTGKKDLQVEPDTRTEAGMENTRDKEYATGNAGTPFYWENDSWKVDQSRLPAGSEVIETSDGPAVYSRTPDGSVEAYGVNANGRHVYVGKSNNSFLPSEYAGVPLDKVFRLLKGTRTYESDRLGDLFPVLDQATAEKLIQENPPVAKQQPSPQTAQAAAKTQTPAPSRKGAGAAGGTESQSAKGSILAVEPMVVQTPPVSSAETEQEKAKREYQEYIDRAYRPTWGTTAEAATVEPVQEQPPSRLTEEEMDKLRSASAKGKMQEAIDEINAAAKPTSPAVETPTESLPADEKPMSGDSGTVRKPKTRKKAAPKPVTNENRAPVQEEEVVVDEAPRPLPPKYKPKVGDLVSGKVNGVPVVGKVARVSGGGTVTAEYGNGKEFVTSNPVPVEKPTHTDESVLKAMTTEEKEQAATELGFPEWGPPAFDAFKKGFADWLVTAQAATKKLATIFSKVLRRMGDTTVRMLIGLGATFGTLNDASSIPYSRELQSPTTPATERFATLEQAPEAPALEPATATSTTAQRWAKTPVKWVAPKSTANMNGFKATKSVVSTANWIVQSGDNKGFPFIVGDKSNGLLYVFDGSGKATFKGPALYGKDIGDSLPSNWGDSNWENEGASRVTPSGRFEVDSLTPSAEYGKVMRFMEGEEVGIAIHRVYLGDKSENRPARLASSSAVDNRVSWGCVNVSDDVFDNVIDPTFSEAGGIVYILPETREGRADFKKQTSPEVFAAQALATAPKYQYTQEQNTAKAARLGLPTTPGVTEDAGALIQNVLVNISKDTRLSPLTRAIARALRSVNFDGVRLRIKADGRSGAGLYTHEKGVGEIMVNLRAVARGQVDSIGVFLHEALHHATMEKLFNPAPGIETEAVEAIKRIVDHVKTLAGPDTVFDYELSNPWEFVSALFTRPDFQNYLASVPAPGSPTGIAKFRSALSELFRRLAELVTGQKVQKGSTMEQAIAATMVLFETPQRTGDGAAEAMAGENAELPQFMRDSLETAKAMAAAGKSSEEIRAVTGWFPGKYDGKMRWEIPDEEAMLDERQALKDIRSQLKSARDEFSVIKSKGLGFTPEFNAAQVKVGNLQNKLAREEANGDLTTVGERLEHPALFAAYPAAKNIRLLLEPMQSNYGGYFDPISNKIAINSSHSKEAQISSLLHEVQHWIQKQENFAEGGDLSQFLYSGDFKLSAEDQAVVEDIDSKIAALREEEKGLGEFFRNLPDSMKGAGKSEKESRRLDTISSEIRDLRDKRYAITKPARNKMALDKYRRTAGEIEARDVQARQNFTPEQRKAVAPYSSENIAKEDAIVMFGGSGPQASIAATMVLFETPQRTGDGAAGAMADRDAEYMAAVEAGDMETAQRMVDEAAKAAGYVTEAYHGSKEEFDEFGEQNTAYGYFFAPDKRTAEYYGPARRFYLKTADMADFTDPADFSKVADEAIFSDRKIRDEEKVKDWIESAVRDTPNGRAFASKVLDLTDEQMAEYESFSDILDDLKKEWEQVVEIVEEDHPQALASLDRDAPAYSEEVENARRAHDELEQSWYMDYQDDFVTAARTLGYDSIFMQDPAGSTGGSPESYVVFDPNQIKSADPVTRGDGNVIPLSQRFNETSNDIRYAASTSALATSKLSPDKARALLTKRFGKAGGKFVVGAFNADGDIEWDAKIGDGNITLNLKYLDTEAKLIAKAEHELAHAVFDDPAVQQEWKAISRTLSPAAREKLAARLKGLGYADAVLDEEMLVQTLEEIRRNTPPAAWQRFVKAVRDALLRLFGMDVSQGDAERAAARIVAAGEAALAQGLDPAVAAFGQSVVDDIRYSRVNPDAELNKQTNVQFKSDKQRNIRPAAPQQETANMASAIIGEAIAKDPVNGRMNALLRFDSDTKIPLEVRAIGAAMLAEQVEYLNVLSARAGNAPPEATDLADDFVDRAISIVQRLGTELGRGLNIFNALARLTPEGFIRRRMRQHAKGVDEVIRQNFTGDLRGEIERLWKMMQEAGNTPRGEAFAAALKAFMPRRVDRKKNIESLFKSAGFRERMAKGGESLVRDFFQMMAGPRDQAGPLAEFDASIQSALSGMLRKVMESKGLVAENQSVQATDIDKLVRSVSADALRFEKIAAADAAMQEELDKIEDPERRAVLQQAWEEATSKMYTNIASEATLRRAVNAELKETPVNWTDLYNSNKGTDAEKRRVVAAVMAKVEALLTNAGDKNVQQNLDMLRSEVAEAFDQVAAIKRAQWLAGREAAESRRRTAERKAAFVEALKVKGISEKALLDLNAKLDLPARPGAERNEVSVLIGDNIKAPVEDFVAKLTALGVDQDTAEALDKVSVKLRAEYAEAARVAALEALKLVPTKLTRQAIERLNSIMAGPMKPHVKGEVATLISDHSKAVVPDFVERMVALGVDRAAAVDLDNILKTSRVDRFLASLLKVAPERNKTAKEKLSKVIRTVLEAGNLGAMDSQQFMDLFAKEFGLPPMTKEFKAEIKEMVRGINALPKGPARIDAIQALEEKLALWEGIKTRDVLMSTWYANILSGVSTQAVGLLYNNLNLFLKSAVTMLANPKSAKAFVQGALGEGLRTGLKEAAAALRGRGLYKVSKWGDKSIINGLELLNKQGPIGPAQWAAYIASVGTLTRKVFHLMAAVDALAWNTAREGHAYLAAHRALREELAGTNPTVEDFNRKFVEKLGGDTAQIEADLKEARGQLIAAGATPDLTTIDRMARQMRDDRRAETQGDNRFADRVVVQQEPEGSRASRLRAHQRHPAGQHRGCPRWPDARPLQQNCEQLVRAVARLHPCRHHPWCPRRAPDRRGSSSPKTGSSFARAPRCSTRPSVGSAPSLEHWRPASGSPCMPSPPR